MLQPFQACVSKQCCTSFFYAFLKKKKPNLGPNNVAPPNRERSVLQLCTRNIIRGGVVYQNFTPNHIQILIVATSQPVQNKIHWQHTMCQPWQCRCQWQEGLGLGQSLRSTERTNTKMYTFHLKHIGHTCIKSNQNVQNVLTLTLSTIFWVVVVLDIEQFWNQPSTCGHHRFRAWHSSLKVANIRSILYPPCLTTTKVRPGGGVGPKYAVRPGVGH